MLSLVASKYNTEASNTSHQRSNRRYRKNSYDLDAHRQTQNKVVRRAKSYATSSVVPSPSLALLSFEKTISTEKTSVLGNERPSSSPDPWPATMDIIAEEIESAADNNSTSTV